MEMCVVSGSFDWQNNLVALHSSEKINHKHACALVSTRPGRHRSGLNSIIVCCFRLRGDVFGVIL
jgi:hypothetical protein